MEVSVFTMNQFSRRDELDTKQHQLKDVVPLREEDEMVKNHDEDSNTLQVKR